MDPHEFQVGANKVFMRESQYQLLRDKMQKAYRRAANTIQIWYHNRYLRKQKELEVASAVVVQVSKYLLFLYSGEYYKKTQCVRKLTVIIQRGFYDNNTPDAVFDSSGCRAVH